MKRNWKQNEKKLRQIAWNQLKMPIRSIENGRGWMQNERKSNENEWRMKGNQFKMKEKWKDKLKNNEKKMKGNQLKMEGT